MMEENKRKQVPEGTEQTPQQMPQEQQMPVEAQRQPTELEIRAQNELKMLEHTAKKKQMQALCLNL